MGKEEVQPWYPGRHMTETTLIPTLLPLATLPPRPTPHCRKSSRKISSCLGCLIVSERHLHVVIIWGSESFPTKKAEASLPFSLGIIVYCWLPCHQMSVRQGINMSSDASNCLYQEGFTFPDYSHVTCDISCVIFTVHRGVWNGVNSSPRIPELHD